MASEPRLSDFAVFGQPQIISAAAATGAKPVLLYLPGIELTGYSVHRQVDDLSADYDVRWLAVPSDDRTNFTSLVNLVHDAVATEHAATDRPVYLAGESFGGVLALSVALRDESPPAGLAGLCLINPATSVLESWPAQLPALLDAVASLPDGLDAATYLALATPIFSAISGDPLQLGRRRSDADLPPPLRLPATLKRLADQLPELTSLPESLPLKSLAYRLPMLLSAAKAAKELKLGALKLPVELLASSEDRVLPSVDEAKRLARELPNAQTTVLRGSGHVPLLEAQVDLAALLREARFLERRPLGRPKDYVSDFAPPSAEQVANATRALSAIRKVTSPVFFSTMPNGQVVRGLGGLPALGEDEPSALFIGNHQLYGATDLPLLVEEVLRQTGTLVRALAHPVAFRKNGRAFRPDDGDPVASGAANGQGARGGGFVDFETFGCVPVSGKALFKLLKRGENVLLYPGGVREAFKSTKKGETYQLFWPDAKESADFAPVAARFGAMIVPVAAIGAEEGFEMVLDADELLSLPVFGKRVAEGAAKAPVGRPGERFVSPVALPKLPGRYYFLFGAPIDASAVDANDKEACAALYRRTQAEVESGLRYLLERRKADPYEAALPRAVVEASWNFTKQAPTFAVL